MFSALWMSLEGVEWYILNSSGFMSVVPLGKVIWSSVVILCISNLCNNLSEMPGFKPGRFCDSCIHAVSRGDGLSRKLLMVLFRWTPALCLSRKSVLVIGDLTQ